nr:membrane-associated protein VP24 [Dehong virus]
MTSLSTRYNLTPPITFNNGGCNLTSAAIWVKEPALEGWIISWAGLTFKVPNTGTTLLKHLKSEFVVKEWQQTRELFSHLFKNQNSSIVEPHLALRLLLGISLRDQELQQSLIPGFRSIVHILSEWLLNDTTTSININPQLLSTYLTEDMFKILIRGIKKFFLKLFSLHIINDRGLPSSIEMKIPNQQMIITRVNMGFLIEKQALVTDPCYGELEQTGELHFGLVIESVLREHLDLDPNQPLNLTQYINSRIAI